MMELIIGGSGSGKSAYAEERAVACARQSNGMAESMRTYYLATMAVYDEEGRQKVERHRQLRSGKGFLTIEQPTAIHGALEKMESGARTVLLECISNLTANEMFSGAEPKREIQVAESVVNGVALLKEQTTHLIVVSNNVFEDGRAYDETTMAYIRAMGRINQRIAALADRVVEVVTGLPVITKE